MKVKATKKGFDGICVREPDEIFDMPDTHKVPVLDDKGKQVLKDGKPVLKEIPVTGSWFEPVKAEKSEKADKADKKDEKSLA